ncbi:MAG: hypothetical protein R3C05_06800 [Pirellulaceae bacterium]
MSNPYDSELPEKSNPYKVSGTESSPPSIGYSPFRESFRVRRVGLLSVTSLFGAMGFAVGLLGAILMGSVTLLSFVMADNTDIVAGVGTGLMMTFMLPLFYGVLGMIGGLIWAVIYNVIANFTGGIQVEIDRS